MPAAHVGEAGRVDRDPVAGPVLHPGMALAGDSVAHLRVGGRMQVAGDVAGRESGRAQEREGDVREVLANAPTRCPSPRPTRCARGWRPARSAAPRASTQPPCDPPAWGAIRPAMTGRPPRAPPPPGRTVEARVARRSGPDLGSVSRTSRAVRRPTGRIVSTVDVARHDSSVCGTSMSNESTWCPSSRHSAAAGPAG
jgi:hypothetical protein